MYIHEETFKQALKHHESLIKEAQNHRHVSYKSFRKTTANILYRLAQMLEPKPQVEQLASLSD